MREAYEGLSAMSTCGIGDAVAPILGHTSGCTVDEFGPFTLAHIWGRGEAEGSLKALLRASESVVRVTAFRSWAETFRPPVTTRFPFAVHLPAVYPV